MGKNWKTNLFIGSLFLGLAVLVGCVSTKGKPIEETKVLEIKKGITTKDEVLEKFGPPDDIKFSPTGEEVFTYRYVETTEVQIGQTIGIVFRRKVPAIGSATTIKVRPVIERKDVLMIFLDRNGVVKHYALRKETGD